jgi:prevent-host-death family protein
MYISMYISKMGKRYSIADARKNLPGIVTEAESGSDIELTRRGKAVAVVVSVHEYERMKGQRRSFSDAYAEFLQRYDLDEVGLDDHFVDGLRPSEAGREIDL